MTRVQKLKDDEVDFFTKFKKYFRSRSMYLELLCLCYVG